MQKSIADHINTLAKFCGKRDISTLSSCCLYEKFGFSQADVMVLFGGSIISGGDVFADAIKCGIAKNYIIVGGAGHTTDTLRQTVHEIYPDITTENLTEAEIFNRYITAHHGVSADFLETESTNCGNNITYLLELLCRNGIRYDSIILSQDATMQYRMEATLQKQISDDITVINYAAYKAEVALSHGVLTYTSNIPGMWDMDRYVNLLMGEIPRLSDNEDGYGPKGKNFITHVDIPSEVMESFEELKKYFGNTVREANPLYASK